MPDIDISGEIGWEVDAWDVKQQFKTVDPEADIEISLASPGGSVFQGVQIGQMVRNHKGKTTLTITSHALSMGSHISQNANTVKVNDDTAWMMHNPWMFTSGDHIELQKDADMLRGLAGMLSIQYAKNSGQEKKAIRKLMDKTTWLYGQEIVDAGFAHEVIATENPETKEDAIAFAQLQFEECMMKLKDYKGNAEDTKQIAALLPTDPPKPAKPVSKTQNQGKIMTEAEFLAFLATNPDAKAFYDIAMGYIKDVADQSQAPDLSAMSLPDVLALAPQAATEHETAVSEAGKEIEAGKMSELESKFLVAALASGKYKASVIDCIADSFNGKATFQESKRMLAQADETLAQLLALGLIKDQPKPTPAGDIDAADDTNLNSPKMQTEIKNLKQIAGVA